MDQVQRLFNGLNGFVGGEPSRRHLLRGLAAAGFGWGVARHSESAEAKKRHRKPKRKKGLCQKNGSACKKPGKQCKKAFCLKAPFTIEARWTDLTLSNHDTFLFVAPEDAATGPSPYIDYHCTPSSSSTCEEAYPFACVSQDAGGPGDEITTISRLLPGTYEYWIELDDETPAGEVTVVLRESGGRVVREWPNPANGGEDQVGWHVFDIDGATGRVTAIDELNNDGPVFLAKGAHDPNTDVCPYNA